MKFFEDLTEEECQKVYGFSKEEMRELYNNGEPLIKQRRKKKNEMSNVFKRKRALL